MTGQPPLHVPRASVGPHILICNTDAAFLVLHHPSIHPTKATECRDRLPKTAFLHTASPSPPPQIYASHVISVAATLTPPCPAQLAPAAPAAPPPRCRCWWPGTRPSPGWSSLGRCLGCCNWFEGRTVGRACKDKHACEGRVAARNRRVEVGRAREQCRAGRKDGACSHRSHDRFASLPLPLHMLASHSRLLHTPRYSYMQMATGTSRPVSGSLTPVSQPNSTCMPAMHLPAPTPGAQRSAHPTPRRIFSTRITCGVIEVCM